MLFRSSFSKLRCPSTLLAGAHTKRWFHIGRNTCSKYALATSKVLTPALRKAFTSRSCKVPKQRSTRPFACGEWCCDPLNPQLPQRPSNLRFRLLSGIFRLPAWWQRRLKHPRLVGVHRLRPAVTLQVAPQHPHVLLHCVCFHKTRVQRIGGIVDQRHQVHHRWPSILQPRMHAGVPLQQFPAAFPPCPPSMHRPHSRPFRFPQSLADHPFPHCLFAHHQAVLLLHIFGDQGRPKIAVLSLHQPHHSLPHPLWQPAVRPSTSQPVDHHPVAFALLAR